MCECIVRNCSEFVTALSGRLVVDSVKRKNAAVEQKRGEIPKVRIIVIILF